MKTRFSWQHYFSFSVLLILAAGALWGWHYLMRPTTWSFHHIKIESHLEHISQSDLEMAAWEHLNGGFFSLDMNHMKSALLQHPWIASVSFRRQWPDTLYIFIREKQALARWGNEGVVTPEGVIFYPKLATIPKGLAMIQGPMNKKEAVLKTFKAVSKDIKLLGLKMSVFVMDQQLSCRFVLMNGITVELGRDEILSRIRRFVMVYPEVAAQQEEHIASVDLRYPNGFAIRWKSAL